ncbi:MAG: hypothetical protein WCD79_04710, partial [Chthoniobacteraceae bacterium]
SRGDAENTVQTYLGLTGLKFGYLLELWGSRPQKRNHPLREWTGRSEPHAETRGIGGILNGN